MTTNFAQRIHNANYKFDPYVRSLVDCDFYKLLMAYFIWKHYPDVGVTFTVKNRTKAVKLPAIVPEAHLREQLDHVRSLRFTKSELIWLKGNSFYGQEGIFPGDFIAALAGLQLPEYHLEVRDGEYHITFSGTWFETTLWEIYALAVINEARSRAAMAAMTKYELTVLYANATSKLVAKLKALKEADVRGIAEFGTRRRHGFLWQEFVIEAMQEELGAGFIGTSNALHAMRMDLEAIGTNAHELPMTITALARLEGMQDGEKPSDKHSVFMSQYRVLEQWEQTFSGNLLVALPDTFGSTQFLQNAESCFPNIEHWTGFREDSKDPYIAAEEKIAFWKSLGVDPRQKLQLFSDGLNHELMIDLSNKFRDRIRCGFGWGTNATNDFRDCDPRGGTDLNPISLVCKVTEVKNLKTGGKVGAVKLSDNYTKATGPEEEIAYYREIFGHEGVADIPVEV